MEAPRKRARRETQAPRTAEEEDAQLRAALAASVAMGVCPFCGQACALDTLERHANACLDQGNDPAPLKSEMSAQGTDPHQKVKEEDSATHRDAGLVDGTEEARAADTRSLSEGEAAGRTEETLAAPLDQQDTELALHHALTPAYHVLQDAAKKLAKPRAPFRTKIPWYKILDGMPISVDAFKYGAIEGCTAYFLTHFHSDHYSGLTSKWTHGPIYCSAITARLVEKHLRVPMAWLHVLPASERFTIPDTGGVTVQCLDANHCPGATMFVFEGVQTVRLLPHGTPSRWLGSARVFRYLHCGDFRSCPRHAAHPALQAPLDAVYLDTTYLDPQHSFPPQAQVIQACCAQVQRPRAPSTLASWLGHARSLEAPLVVVGTYSIGKERLVKALARTLGTRIYCTDAKKHATYQLLDDPELAVLLTRDPLDARVHVTNLFSLATEALSAYATSLQARGMTITHTMAFRPTGWTHRPKRQAVSPAMPLETLLPMVVPPAYTDKDMQPARGSSSTVFVYAVPYSEHSSFYELLALMLTLQYRRIIPTVHGSTAQQARMRQWLDAWTQARAPGVAARDAEYW